jgi:site-specific DNA recombinase
MKYIIYCRKSTESDDRQVLSIDSQESTLLEIARNNSYEIFRTFKESKSAKKPGRPVFNEMMSFMEKTKDEYCILTWNLDRLARNSFDGGNIIWFMDQGLITEIMTYDKVFKNNADDKMMMNMVFGFAKKYVDDLSKNVKRGNKTKMEQGGWPGYSPYGYLNDKANKTILVDEERSGYVKRCFELFSSGRFNLREVTKIMEEEGMRSRGGCKVSKSNIQNILTSTFYYGFMHKGDNYYQGNHEPLISKKTFDDAQEVLKRRGRFKKEKHFFHLRGLFTCAVCGCTLTASKKKGHDYYYCTNGKKVCSEHKNYLRSEVLDNLIVPFFEKINIDEDIIQIAYESVREERGLNKVTKMESIEVLSKQLEGVKRKQEVLLDSFVSQTTPKDIYASKMGKLNGEEIDIKQRLSFLELEESKQAIIDDKVRDFLLDTKKMKDDYFNSSEAKKNLIANRLLWNLSMSGQEVLSYKAKEPFDVLLNGPKICDSVSLLPCTV